MIVTRHPHAGIPGALRFRWWLKHQGERWLIHDLEDIDYGIRLSTLLALSLEPIPNNTGVLRHPHLSTLAEAANGVLTKDNFADAERTLKDVRTDDLARPYVAMHHMILASAFVRQKRYQDTVASAEIVQNAQPDMPGNDYVLSLSLSSLNRNEEALKYVEKARAWIGDDPDICYQFGFTFHNLRRYPEAAAQYRKVYCLKCQGVRVEQQSFCDSSKRMTLRFMNLVFQLCKIMTVSDVARHFALDPKAVKAIDLAGLEREHGQTDYDNLRILAIDEIAVKKGHIYMTVVLDYLSGRVVAVLEGRKKETLDG